MSKLHTIREEAASPEALNKSASYIQHLINWRQFVIKKLLGDLDFDIELNTKADWSDVTIEQFADWDSLIETLRQSQKQLTALIGDQSDEALQLQVPGKKYNRKHMLQGLIQHEVYHTGQISVYWKLQ